MNATIGIRSHIEAPRRPATLARRAARFPHARRYAAAFAAGVALGAVWTYVLIVISSP
jgi:hypothetical protein